ncbi:MAG: hypothetical protein IJ710_07045 [Prevotella sp.]|nr:hypothetical protein [Prevotella sp.]
MDRFLIKFAVLFVFGLAAWLIRSYLPKRVQTILVRIFHSFAFGFIALVIVFLIGVPLKKSVIGRDAFFDQQEASTTPLQLEQGTQKAVNGFTIAFDSTRAAGYRDYQGDSVYAPVVFNPQQQVVAGMAQIYDDITLKGYGDAVIAICEKREAHSSYTLTDLYAFHRGQLTAERHFRDRHNRVCTIYTDQLVQTYQFEDLVGSNDDEELFRADGQPLTLMQRLMLSNSFIAIFLLFFCLTVGWFASGFFIRWRLRQQQEAQEEQQY